MRHHSLAMAVAALLTAAASTSVPAETIHLHADLTGEAQTGGSVMGAGGEAEATLDTETMIIEWTVSYHDMSGPLTGAHIHGPAEPGSNAGIAIAFDGIVSSPFSGAAELTAEEIAGLLEGLYYVNLHTGAHPGGEVRGHLMPVDSMMGD